MLALEQMAHLRNRVTSEPKRHEMEPWADRLIMTGFVLVVLSPFKKKKSLP
jgi:hypothetical protein